MSTRGGTLTLPSVIIRCAWYRDFVPHKGRWANYPVSVMEPIDPVPTIFKPSTEDIEALQKIINTPSGLLRISGMFVLSSQYPQRSWSISKDTPGGQIEIMDNGTLIHVPVAYMLNKNTWITSMCRDFRSFED